MKNIKCKIVDFITEIFDVILEKEARRVYEFNKYNLKFSSDEGGEDSK